MYILNYDVCAYVHYTLYMLLHLNWYICKKKKLNYKKKEKDEWFRAHFTIIFFVLW